ncbi:hypothetical protein TNIN_228091 [Trichonephila inaurata madagascariensis]|uniref:Uncharacterized protein n=1 Tax=Trichonephila inaurata madagascariensis TaxID=2747483 RepID=A0A8X6X2L0_9ARAC|nr:hypothetical protein TNIN_228091 [Trichonephila inaurata madagascariensis]
MYTNIINRESQISDNIPEFDKTTVFQAIRYLYRKFEQLHRSMTSALNRARCCYEESRNSYMHAYASGKEICVPSNTYFSNDLIQAMWLLEQVAEQLLKTGREIFRYMREAKEKVNVFYL